MACGTAQNSADRWSPIETCSIPGDVLTGPRSPRRHSIVGPVSPSQHSRYSLDSKRTESPRSDRQHSIVATSSPSQSPILSPVASKLKCKQSFHRLSVSACTSPSEASSCSSNGSMSKKIVLSPVIRKPKTTIRNTSSPLRRRQQDPRHEDPAALPVENDGKRDFTSNKCHCPPVSNCVGKGYCRGRHNDITPRRPLRNRSPSPSK